MPDYMDVDPDELRRIAEQHDRTAADIRKWGEIPHGWLDEFPNSYGAIADPVLGALVDYYNRRQARAKRRAASHEQSRDQLHAAANALDEGDRSGAADIEATTPDGQPSSAGPTDSKGVNNPRTPAPHSPGGPIESDPQSGQPPETRASVADNSHPSTDSSTLDDKDRSGQGIFPSPVSQSPAGETMPSAVLPTAGAVPPSIAEPPDGAVTTNITAPNPTSETSQPNNPSTAPIAPPAVAPVVADSLRGTTTSDPVAVRSTPYPLRRGPFAAVAHANKTNQNHPPFVVGKDTEDDLTLARNLVSAILTATIERGLEWAVAVLRHSGGPIVLVTSSEGRGWLPSGLFLPTEVCLPWRWDRILDSRTRESLMGLEGTTDPARILVEFGLHAGDLIPLQISALASSTEIRLNVHDILGRGAAEGSVQAKDTAFDLTSPGVGLVDRLTLAGSNRLLRKAAAVPESEIATTCLELAQAADRRVRNSLSATDQETSQYDATRRRRILDAICAGRPVPDVWLERVRDTASTVTATLRSRAVDMSDTPIGNPMRADRTQALRGMTFERHADELLLLVAESEPNHRTLRDALYVYGQVTEHPLLSATARIAAVTRDVAAAKKEASAPIPEFITTHEGQPNTNGLGSISVSPMDRLEAPPPITELLRNQVGTAGSADQRTGR